MKHDGFRVLARKQGGRVDVWSRFGTDFTGKFLNIAAAVRELPAESALIDGEAVAFLPGGHSDFAALRTKAGGARASLVAFDLLSLEGKDLRERPLEERREALARLVSGVGSIQFSASVAEDGAIVFAHACELGLEGIVSKRAGRGLWIGLRFGVRHPHKLVSRRRTACGLRVSPRAPLLGE